MKCPLCAASVTYQGLREIECAGRTCPNAGKSPTTNKYAWIKPTFQSAPTPAHNRDCTEAHVGTTVYLNLDGWVSVKPLGPHAMDATLIKLSDSLSW